MTYNPFQQKNPLDDYRVGTPIKLSVIVNQQRVYKEDSGFCVYYVENEHGETFQIKGVVLTPLVLQHTYFVDGKVTEFHGIKQLDFKEIYPAKPINKKATIAYLQTVKGLKSKAENIYNEFGEDSIDILLNNPDEVAKRIKGVGKKSAQSWHEQLQTVNASQYVIKTLLGYDLSIKQARKLHELYDDDIVTIIQENPYRLSYEVKGYGFERCDRIARNMGFDPFSLFRAKEGLQHVLNKAIQEGHCFLPKDELLEKTKEVLRIRLNQNECLSFLNQYEQMATELEEPYLIAHNLGGWSFQIPYYDVKEMYQEYKQKNNAYIDFYGYTLVDFEEFNFELAIEQLIKSKDLYNDDDNYYLPSLYYSERIVTKNIKALTQTYPFKNQINLEEALDDYCEQNHFELETKQREAAILFAQERGGIFVLTGSAGCGKSFTLKVILGMLEHQYKENGKRIKIELLAPTGKASKVVTKSTNRECKTVHRGLEYSQEGFQINSENPLEADVIVVDESSMLDIELAAALLEAIKLGTKLILLGDTQQLPSVGPGNVLKDIIESGLVPCVKLDVVKRQNSFSSILLNANNIINGEMIQNYPDKKDSFLIEREPQSIVSTVIQSIKRVLTFPNHYSHEDIQVLAPQKNGTLGTHYLNYCIQQTFYPDKNGELTVLNRKFDINIDGRKESLQLRFKVGDKVIHIKNNKEMIWYETIGESSNRFVPDKTIQGITNGECGVIEQIFKKNDNKDTVIIVKYEERYVLYENNFEELDHAWALTIHKSQGSQWKALILPMARQYYRMLDNNLFYTAYTRAEEFNVVIGQSSAIKQAIQTHNSYKRYTGLKKRLLAA